MLVPKVLFFVLGFVVRQCKSLARQLGDHPLAADSIAVKLEIWILIFFRHQCPLEVFPCLCQKFWSLFLGFWCGSANHQTRWSPPGSRQHCCESSFLFFTLSPIHFFPPAETNALLHASFVFICTNMSWQKHAKIKNRPKTKRFKWLQESLVFVHNIRRHFMFRNLTADKDTAAKQTDKHVSTSRDCVAVVISLTWILDRQMEHKNWDGI